MEIAFGPVYSRRLGKSLGVNNIAYKYCSYACTYCQLGNTVILDYKRRKFYEPETIYESVKKRLDELEEKPDYITFVPDGEPTLDINLGKEIELLKGLGIPIAVFTNSTLLWDENVRRDLMSADLVSIKVDAVSENIWRFVDRPPKGLKLEEILKGIELFSEEYRGRLISETMLVNRVDYTEEAKKIALFLKGLKHLDKAYISIPTRPTALSFVKPPSPETLNYVYQKFVEALGPKVETLTGYEKREYSLNSEEEILATLAVHPIREDLLKNKDLTDKLVKENKIKRVNYNGVYFYVLNYNNLRN